MKKRFLKDNNKKYNEINIKKLSEYKKEILKKDPLRDFFVLWDDISREKVEKLRKTVNLAKDEKDLQKFFEKYPIFLVQHLGSGHGRWCIPKKRLGSEFVPDFLIGERSSKGFEWHAVEIESPKVKLFNRKGDPSRYLNHSIRQIMDWRVWLKNNINYAQRSKNNQGLGLTDIDGDIKGFVLIGRHISLDEKNLNRRRQMCIEHNTEIHTYDWLVKQAEWRCNKLNK